MTSTLIDARTHNAAKSVSAYYAALSDGHFSALDTLLTDEYEEHELVPGVPPTRDGLKQKYTLLRGGFSDFAFAVEDVVVAGDRAAVRVTVRGTHDGPFMGRPAT